MLKKFLIVLALVSILTIPVVVLADDYGLGAAAPSDLKTSKLGTDIPSIVGNVVGVGLSLLGVIFFLLILYAGILWMTALGNEKKVDTAKSIMEAAGIGLMIVLGAYAITTFLFKNVAGTTGGAGGAGSNPPAGNDTAGCCTFPGVNGVNVASQADCGGSGVFVLGPCPTGGQAPAGNGYCCNASGGLIGMMTEEQCTGGSWSILPCNKPVAPESGECCMNGQSGYYCAAIDQQTCTDLGGKAYYTGGNCSADCH